MLCKYPLDCIEENVKDVIAKRKQAERQDRVQQILAAGRKLFLEKDYQGATMRDIALEAALSTGAVYFYFKGKDEIFGKVCEEAFQVLLGELKKAAQNPGTPIERFERVVKAYVAFYTNYPDYFAILELGFRKIELPEEISSTLNELYLQAISILKGIIEEGIRQGYFASGNGNGWELTVTFWASIEGLLFLHRVGQLEGMSLESLVDNQIRIFEKGTCPNGRHNAKT